MFARLPAPNRGRFIASAVAWAGIAGAARSARAEGPVLRVGAAANETYAQPFYAQDNGFFRAAGLNVEITVLTSGAALVAGVTSGALDIAGASTVAIANAHAHGLPVFLIAPAGVYNSASPTTGLVVAKDSPLRTAADLNGKAVAVTTLRDISQDAVMAWLDKNQGDSSKVQFIELPASEMGSAVQAGRVAAAFIPEPNLTKAAGQTRYFASAYDGIAKEFMVIGWLAAKGWIDANTDMAKTYASVMRQTADWANKNKRASAEILAKYAKLPADTIASMHRTSYVQGLNSNLIQPVIDVTAHYKTLAQSFPANELFYPGIR
jgi:NitT/TauT family transport system substrate-binding protein